MRRDQWTTQKIPFRTYYICFVVYSSSAQNLPSCLIISQAFGAYKKSGVNLGVNYQNSGVVRGVTREGKGAQFPGRRITAGGATKSQQCHKYFRQYSTFASEIHQVRTRGRQTCFLARVPSSLITPLSVVGLTTNDKPTLPRHMALMSDGHQF